MNELDSLAFSALFKEAVAKCFGHPLSQVLSETDSRHFSNTLLEQTGLVIGPKSIKNYSAHIIDPANRQENPSVATLDTLARYVLNAPYTDEVTRKNKEGHYPYWFQFREKFFKEEQMPVAKKSRTAFVSLLLGFCLVALIIGFILFFKDKRKTGYVQEDFYTTNDDSLIAHGWFVQAKNAGYWARRGELEDHLTLFTLPGDNWPDSTHRPGINNLLLREVSGDCFTVEVQLTNFVPSQNWQQAGLLLSEDTSFSGRSLRLSLAYNDFGAGFPKSREIILQGIVYDGKSGGKMEEMIHLPIFQLDSANEELVKQNLRHSTLRIEKQGSRFRLLYAGGAVANSAFREIGSHVVGLDPHFIGLFAIQGFTANSSVVPARFDQFRYLPLPCKSE